MTRKKRGHFSGVIEKWALHDRWLRNVAAVFPFSVLLHAQVLFWRLAPVRFLALYKQIRAGMEAALEGLDTEARATFTGHARVNELAARAIRETLWVLSYFTTLVIKQPWDTILHGLKSVQFADTALVRKLHDEGRPIVIVSPHLSTSFLIPVLFAMQGFKVSMVEDLIRTEAVRGAVTDWLRKLALLFRDRHSLLGYFQKYNLQAYANIKDLGGTQFDLELISVSKASMRCLSERLSQGRVVILFNDYRHVKGRHELTDALFGMHTCVARGAASLLSRHGGVAFGCAITKQEKNMLMNLGPPILSESGQGIDELALTLFRESRRHIYSNPQQWTLWPKISSHLKAEHRVSQ